MQKVTDAMVRPMSIDSPAPKQAINCRLRMARRMEGWRTDLAALKLGIIGTGPRARVGLSRDLEDLVAEGESMMRIIDDLATAPDGAAWHDARLRGEAAWSRLQRQTRRLRQKIHRNQRGKSGGPRSGSTRSSRANGGSLPASDSTSAIETPAVPHVLHLEAPVETPSRPERRTRPGPSRPTLRVRGLRLWSAVLLRWGVFLDNEGLQLAGIRYRLIADLESGQSGPTHPSRPIKRPPTAVDLARRVSGGFALPDPSQAGW